jgi:hypothetical protein
VEITMLASTTTNEVAPMTTPERLTWDEICRRYPDEWVVVTEIQPVDEMDEMIETDETAELYGVCCVPIEDCTSVVIAHGTNRKSLSPEIKALQPHHPDLGSFFTGRLIPPAYELLVP